MTQPDSADSATSTPVTDDAKGALDPRRVTAIFAALMLTMLMTSLGQMIFSTALPTIVGQLGGIDHMTWVITGFLLGQTIALPIFGKLGDMWGRKGLYMFSVALFVVGSIVGAMANSMNVLILARVFQGIAGGGMMIMSQATIADIIPARSRGKYMGVMGSVFGVSSVLGPLLGGWFTDGPGWRWGLWLNVPLGLIALTAIFILLHVPARERSTLPTDWLGMAVMAVATSSLILCVTWGGTTYPWSSATIIGLAVLSLVSWALLVVVERKAANPLIPPMLFAKRNFVLATGAGVMIGVFMFGSLAYVPTYLQMVHSISPTEAGLMMIPMMLGMMGTSILAGNLVTRTGRYKIYPILGQVITFFALVMMSFLKAESTLWTVGVCLLVLGIGLGLCMQILVLIVQNTFPITVVGTATAANNFFRQIGGALGSALVGSLFVDRLHEQLAVNVPPALAELGPNAAAEFGKMQSRLTPALVAELPEKLRLAIDVSYNDALTPIFLWLSPLAIVATVMLCFLTEDRLKETIS